jgi:Icc-related predicted phosphoesterase
MKIAIGSDIHLEFGPIALKNVESADVLILAGDICMARDFELGDKNLFSENKRAQRYHAFFEGVSREFPKVIYILGNHEHYNGDFAYSYSILKRHLAKFENIHVMEKETLELDGVTFVCATMWTSMNDEDPITLHAVKDMMNDFRNVKNSNRMVQRKVPLYDNEHYETNEHGYVVRNVVGHKYKEEPAKFSPEDSVEDHKRAMDYINHVLMNDETKKYVVVTHHTPSWQSCHERYVHDRVMNGAFHTELGDYIAYRPQIKLWVHGHTHEDFDYVIGETRVVCNPRGYNGHENRADSFKLLHVEVL